MTVLKRAQERTSCSPGRYLVVWMDSGRRRAPRGIHDAYDGSRHIACRQQGPVHWDCEGERSGSPGLLPAARLRKELHWSRTAVPQLRGLQRDLGRLPSAQDGKGCSGFSEKATGVRRDQHPTCFQKIRPEFEVRSSTAAEDDVRKAVRPFEESLCPVWVMLKSGVEIEVVYRLPVT
jgi:hypothetical protein